MKWKKTNSYQICHVFGFLGLGSIHFVLIHREILPGAGTEAAQNFLSSASLFSRSPQDRDGCKAFSYRPFIDWFDKTQEYRISKQELSWKGDDQVWVSFEKCRMDRHPVLTGQSDILTEISLSTDIKPLKNTDASFSATVQVSSVLYSYENARLKGL